MATKNYSYIGSGILYIKKKGASEGREDVGNVSNLQIDTEENERTLTNYRGGGGNYDADRQLSSVTASITMHDFSPENLELALRGTITEVSSGDVTSEEHTVYVGAFTPLDHIPDFSQSHTVTLDPGGTATTLTEGTDYELTETGIRPLEGGAVTDGDTVGVDYTKRKSAIVHSLMGAASELDAFFEGLNDAQNMPVNVHLKRIKMGVPSGLGFITDDFASLEVTADVLADQQAEPGTSAFFDVDLARKE